ncbi:hypothetical protein OIU77_030737 [Salix suchowensis]|uniref:Uncharacterized protein n=1 Tax=Salix suchowensis TaxID=1278906 RepID=A0ABQ9BG28_9ROSI|nr:hypothetical protein OIU77_030737 [Salix suchowensis]
MAARAPFNVTERTPKTGAVTPHSPWHSPVPYLFGGLAAMLGLIAFALLILACSYWKLSGYLESGNEGGERDLEAGEGENKSGDGSEKKPVAFEEKILVIMAGEVKPTFLATPMASRSTSFGDTSSEKSCSCSSEESEKLESVNDVQMVKQGDNDEDHQDYEGALLQVLILGLFGGIVSVTDSPNQKAEFNKKQESVKAESRSACVSVLVGHGCGAKSASHILYWFVMGTALNCGAALIYGQITRPSLLYELWTMEVYMGSIVP